MEFLSVPVHGHYDGKGAPDPRRTGALMLAYIGDSVYDLYVRSRMLSAFTTNTEKAHTSAVAIVNAVAQSRVVEQLYDFLTPQEQSIYRRGRNAKSAHTPKNASVLEYKRATGFEAVLGYLYLDRQTERLDALLERAYALAVHPQEPAGSGKP